MKVLLKGELIELEKSYLKEFKRNIKLAHKYMFPHLSKRELSFMIRERKNDIDRIRDSSIEIVNLYRSLK